jgi:shikimate dehydrogenase
LAEDVVAAARGRYCLIGSDTSASVSPEMMNAAFSHLGLAERYFALSLEADQLGEWFGRLRRAGILGMNVTLPFKTSIIPLLDALDPVAARVGAVNVIKKKKKADSRSGEESYYVGYNSDVDGIVRPLAEVWGSTDLRHGRALLIGAGGVARAFVEAMSHLECPVIIVVVRDPARAEGFVTEMKRAHPGMDMELYSFDKSSAVEGHVDLLFNGTPVGSVGRTGMPSEIFRLIGPGTTVFDAVYRPIETELIRGAEARGCRVIRGYEMLLNQGAVAFELWTGRSAPLAIMREAILKKLRGNN